jgi:hypothetical protein
MPWCLENGSATLNKRNKKSQDLRILDFGQKRQNAKKKWEKGQQKFSKKTTNTKFSPILLTFLRDHY